MAYKFNGSSANIANTAATPLLSIRYVDQASEIDVTGANSTTHVYEAGLPNKSVVAEIVGGSAVATGATGTTTITFADNTNVNLGNTVVTSVEISGSVDDRIVRSVTVRQAI